LTAPKLPFSTISAATGQYFLLKAAPVDC